MDNYKNIKVDNIYESIIRSGYAMQTGSPVDFPKDPESLKELAMKRYKTAKNLGQTAPGTGHNNFLKGIHVSFDMKISQVLLPQFERYHWLEIISSQSKMHRIVKGDFEYHPYVSDESISVVEGLIIVYNNFVEYSDDEGLFHFYKNNMPMKLTKPQLFEAIVYNCPMGLQLWMGVDTNYLQLKTVVGQRHNHKMSEWNLFTEMCKSLPLFEELTNGKN